MLNTFFPQVHRSAQGLREGLQEQHQEGRDRARVLQITGASPSECKGTAGETPFIIPITKFLSNISYVFQAQGLFYFIKLLNRDCSFCIDHNDSVKTGQQNVGRWAVVD